MFKSVKIALAAITWLLLGLAVHAAPSNCRLASEVCVEGGGTRTVNGVTTYQDCWRKRRSYQCGGPGYANYCAGIEGACSMVSKNCVATGGDGQCDDYKLVYNCGNEVNDGNVSFINTSYTITKDEVTDTCSAQQAANCTVISTTCTEGAEVKTINGLAVYKDCWAWDRKYSCSNPDKTNTCSSYEGSCSRTAQSCSRTHADGTCAETREEYVCPDPVSGSGDYVETIYKVTGDKVTADCAAEDGSCAFVNEVCVDGPGNRTVNGLSVYRDCWKWQKNYECGTANPYNHCAAYQNAGCSLVSESCVKTGYKGACLEWKRRMRCPDPTNGDGSMVDTIYTITGDAVNESACADKAASCKFVTQRCVEGAGTRNINGLNVTKDCWKWEKEYLCANPNPTTTCGAFDSNGGCAAYPAECIETFSEGTCKRYSVKYRCENNVSGQTPVDTAYDIVRDDIAPSCEAQTSNASCVQGGDVCVEGAATRNINGLNVYKSCWAWSREYTCRNPDYKDGCADYRGSCQQLSNTCVQNYGNGACSMTQQEYYCENTVNGGGTHIETINQIIRDDVINGCGDLEDTTKCQQNGSEVCLEGAETRVIGNVPVYKNCWRWGRDYTCKGPQANDCAAHEAHCAFVGKRCVKQDPQGNCTDWERDYRCGSTKPDGSLPPTVDCGGQIFCLNGECDTITREPNDEFASSMTWLSLLKDFHTDFDPNTQTVFKGEKQTCRKAVIGFLNCCKDAGWGVDIGIANCTAEEKALPDKIEAGNTVYIGTYCSVDGILGVCLERKRSYCAFDGRLARIIHEQGRQQLNIGWGTPKTPDCRGLTLQELQRLDFSRIDLREFYPKIYEYTKYPDFDGTTDAMQDRIQQFYGQGNGTH